MKRRFFLIAIAAASFASAPGCTKKDSGISASGTQTEHQDPEGYYTCPMHPQVHQHEPGPCPICGMALVKVGDKKQDTKSKKTGDFQLQSTEQQLNLAGIGKHTVQSKDLIYSILVAGRLVSSREVAFQVYESDLQIVKAGLEFQGSLSSSPQEILRGQIKVVDTIIDPSSRTIRVLGILTNSPKRTIVDGGFFGEIKSVLEKQLAVPENAVLHAGHGDLVYLVSPDNKLKPVFVTLGRKTGHEYQILSGLKEGDIISSGPNFLIDSEAKIRGGNDQTHH